MTNWYVLIQTDTGAKRWAFIKADNAGAAMARAEVDPDRVLTVKRRDQTRPRAAFVAAAVGLYAYIMAVLSSDVLSKQSLTETGLIMGAILCLFGLMAVLGRIWRARDPIEQSPVKWRGNLLGDLERLDKFTVLGLWFMIAYALVMGWRIVMSAGGEELPTPADVMYPVLFLGFGLFGTAKI